MNKGTVKWFNAEKGYGFITGEDLSLIHISRVRNGINRVPHTVYKPLLVKFLFIEKSVKIEMCIRDSLFTAAHSREHPLFRSYVVNLPSSLTTLLPLALEFSS